ncbi:MAG: N-acyl amino acid synthase of PEP-CTERM/exosortase system [Paraglaciecola sp.]|jgi:N-acyl amino acid synthase of PEP-CTERM/exosortase system
MKHLRKYTDTPFIGPVIDALINFVASHKANQISQHFSEYLNPVVALDDMLKEESYKIRYNVYCEELHFEDVRNDKMETDEFDAHSIHCLIQHIPTGEYAGTVRIVRSENESQLLPIEKYCISSISKGAVHPSDFPRSEIGEISRLTVPAQFRKRSMDKFQGSATGVINEHIYSERELRCFPFIAVGLYLCAASTTRKYNIKHCFVMMEPRLARSLRFVGISFQQVGPVVEYHGRRAPYYIDRDVMINSLTPGFKRMFKHIEKNLWRNSTLE